MTLKIEIWHGLLLLLVLVVFSIFHTSASPYYNNTLHGHRWRTDICRQNGEPLTNCTIGLPPIVITDNKQRILSNEQPQFDICLEHGEWRRIK